MWAKVLKFLESVDIRCRGCGKWLSGVYSTKRKLEWGTNVGGLLLADPFYVLVKVCTCSHCGQTISSQNIGTEDADV